MHRWIAMTLFPIHDVRWVRTTELKLLYVIVHKIKVAPVKEMFHHWLELIRKSSAITCTSLVTRIANAIGALDRDNIEFISIPRTIIDEQFLIKGHHLKTNPAGELSFFFPSYANKI